jgi:glutamate dehydrogenase (NAD(P)+)
VGFSVPGVVTGKPLSIGGSLGRDEATGRGVVYVAIEALKHLGLKIHDSTVAVQGFGNVGWNTARIMQESGAKVIAVSDKLGGIYNRSGLDIKQLHQRYLTNGQSLADIPMGDHITNEELLALECTILVPAALSEQINDSNGNKIQCRILAEGANGPTTLEADRILNDKGVFIIPDILANSGGVIVSYFEWVQDAQRFSWNETDIRERLRDIITASFQRTLAFSQSKGTSMRMAALMSGIDLVAQAHRVRGLYP